MNPYDEITVLIKRGRELALYLLSLSEDLRRRLSLNQEEGLYQELNHAGTLVVVFQPPRTMRNKCTVFQPPVLGYSVIAA